MELVEKDLYKSFYEKWIGENSVNAVDLKLNKFTPINDLNGLVRTNLIPPKCSNA